MADEFYVRGGGVWSKVRTFYAKAGGVWRTVTGYCKVNGSWRVMPKLEVLPTPTGVDSTDECLIFRLTNRPVGATLEFYYNSGGTSAGLWVRQDPNKDYLYSNSLNSVITYLTYTGPSSTFYFEHFSTSAVCKVRYIKAGAESSQFVDVRSFPQTATDLGCPCSCGCG